MDTGDHLAAFFAKSEEDGRIGPLQVCLYMALLCQWNRNFKVNPFQIERGRIMRMAKISARSTFGKSMKTLQQSGYIKYIPSYNPDISSMVCIHELAREDNDG